MDPVYGNVRQVGGVEVEIQRPGLARPRDVLDGHVDFSSYTNYRYRNLGEQPRPTP